MVVVTVSLDLELQTEIVDKVFSQSYILTIRIKFQTKKIQVNSQVK